ncbi:colicin E3/pyocin S6 family cytotoxin [Heyndrickxia coagulans]|uniref:colicin E3/pyocin S6 family cytotoxin n=1 Tax=Heyndrickxia coagulans TaxID=1398 RepID=UPI002E1F5722|nr:colicin E3/pyocin S6 family cytotoxin [Heyndrickxia coagulans]MED4943280.1 colicin E3/pyocin S6 family cytotoxin [Heyndrickxia coagulans]
MIRTVAANVAKQREWKKDSKLTKQNGRDVYFDYRSSNYYALDTQHGRFEVVNKKGKHKGEVDFNLNPTKPAYKSGGHDLKIK